MKEGVTFEVYHLIDTLKHVYLVNDDLKDITVVMLLISTA